jgi:PIN domain nuclease of toxin-antitoxin system
VRLLLDTHALLWWLAGDERLPLAARREIDAEGAQVFASAASAWEIATKYRLRRLPETVAPLALDFGRTVVRHGFIPLDITVGHAQDAGALPDPLGDPFDRMLVAQARAERTALVSNESAFDRFGVVRIW